MKLQLQQESVDSSSLGLPGILRLIESTMKLKVRQQQQQQWTGGSDAKMSMMWMYIVAVVVLIGRVDLTAGTEAAAAAAPAAQATGGGKGGEGDGGGRGAEGGDTMWGYEPVRLRGVVAEPPVRVLPPCYVRPKLENEYDKDVHATVLGMLRDYQLNLVDYTLLVYNRTHETNPLQHNNTWNYKSQFWSRVRSTYGRTILSLAFNYKILSLLTFTVSVEEFKVELEDVPLGCLAVQNETEKVLIVRDLLLRDFSPTGLMTVIEGEDAVCHQVIVPENGYAHFTDECCFRRRDDYSVACEVDRPNLYIASLDVIIAAVFVFAFFFGPLFIPQWVHSSATETNNYVVKLKTPHYKTICICYGKRPEGATADHVIDLRNRRDFLTCRKIISELPADAVIPAKIGSYNVSVDYGKLVDENRISVSLFESVFQAIFLCKINNHEAVRDCCGANTGLLRCSCCSSWPEWSKVCNIFGKILLALCIPIPYYMRVAVYYAFENDEVTDRKVMADRLGLHMLYNYRMMQYLTPIHPIYIISYIFYLAVGLLLAFKSESTTRTRFQQQVILSLADLRHISWLAAMTVLAKNIIWPFKRFGLLGIFVGPFWWAIILPITLLAVCFYCIPLIFLTSRIIFHRFRDLDYVEDENVKRRIEKFEADYFLNMFCSKSMKNRMQNTFHLALSPEEIIVSIVVTLLAIVALCSCMLMLAEVLTSIAEVFVFTFMGLIVNAAALIKFATLLFLAIVYAYDTFTGVTKKYLKLNKNLFALIKDYVGRDLWEFTSMPSWLQENRAFKTSSQQDDHVEYVQPDDVMDEPPSHWRVNELVLFVDNEDRPRIPRLLFDRVCEMKVPGSPGPVYLSYMQAMRKFLNICLFLVFIFLVVLSFGESHKVSPANQMLAAMAGGFMPMFFRTIMRQDTPGVETDLVSFRSKLQEVVKGFCQCWPMFDLIFDVGEEPVEEDKDFDSGGGGGGESGGGSKPGGGDGGGKGGGGGGGDGGKGGGAGGGAGSGDQNKSHTDGGDKDKGKAGGGGGGGGGAGGFPGRRPVDGGKQRRALEVAQRLATLKDQIDSMQLMPARDKHVDILILTENSDIEWVMEESFSEYDPGLGASMPSLGGGPGGKDRIKRMSTALPVPTSPVSPLDLFIPGTAVLAADCVDSVARDAAETTPLVAEDVDGAGPSSGVTRLPPPPPPKGIAALALGTIGLLIPKEKDLAAPVSIDIPSSTHQQQQQQAHRIDKRTAVQQ